MTHTKLASAICGMALLVLASLAVPAAENKDMMTSPDGRWTFAIGPRSVPFTPYANLEPNLVPIFNNLGTAYPLGIYWCCTGGTISGELSDIEAEFWEAAAFTPRADGRVMAIAIALSHVSGTSKVTLSLNDDVGGVPGAVLRKWTVSNMPQFRSCCVVNVKKDDAGIPVKAYRQYWVAVTTEPNSDAYVTWNLNDSDQVNVRTSAYAFYGNWTATSFAPGFGFAVLGQTGH